MKPQAPKQSTHALPLGDPKVTLILVDEEGDVLFANTRDDKMDALLDYDGAFYAVWPGQFQSHLFHVNRREALKTLAASRGR